MQNKYYRKIVLILIITTFLCLVSSIITAAGLEIINMNYNVINSKSDTTKQYYNIFVTIENQEETSYNNITIELMDEWDIPTRQYYDFQPLEKKTIIFEEFPLAGGTTHDITVNYYPSNSSLQSSANTGTSSFSITYNKGSTSDTPFITPLSVIVIMVVVSLLIRKRTYLDK